MNPKLGVNFLTASIMAAVAFGGFSSVANAASPVVPVSVSASGNDGNGPDRLIDNNLKTRWSINGDAQWAVLDYGQSYEFDGVRLAFHKGDKRSTYFDIEVSTDGNKWKKVIKDGKSSGAFLTYERFNFTPVKARYVRYVGHGNSANNWNSVTEFSAVNCSVTTCAADEVKTAAMIKKAQKANALAEAKRKAEKKKNKQKAAKNPGNFGAKITLQCDPTVSDCSCLKVNPKCTWWQVPLPKVKVPAVVRATNKPGQNFDLGGWYLTLPTDQDNNGKADNIPEQYLAQGFEEPEMFYTAKDGGMTFRTYVKGVRTSNNTHYVRTELREMLRRGDTSIPTQGVNKNNWVFSSAPVADQKVAGGVDGEMNATLKIDHTTTTGEANQVGRFIIGQIHEKNDEPIRLYYRKLPNNPTGAVYFAHENSANGAKDTYYNLIGDMSGAVKDGIPLGEIFSYRIKVVGNTLTVTLMREGKKDIVKTVDMSKSGYDVGGRFMYFKAGAYNQNSTGDPDDYVQATFYKLTTTHDHYHK